MCTRMHQACTNCWILRPARWRLSYKAVELISPAVVCPIEQEVSKTTSAAAKCVLYGFFVISESVTLHCTISVDESCVLCMCMYVHAYCTCTCACTCNLLFHVHVDKKYNSQHDHIISYLVNLSSFLVKLRTFTQHRRRLYVQMRTTRY